LPANNGQADDVGSPSPSAEGGWSGAEAGEFASGLGTGLGNFFGGIFGTGGGAGGTGEADFVVDHTAGLPPQNTVLPYVIGGGVLILAAAWLSGRN